MGWLTMPRASMDGHATAKAYLDAQFTYVVIVDGHSHRLEVLASACLQNRVYYAAARKYRDGIAERIFAIVCLVSWRPRAPDGYVFGYKSMDETMGPNEASCPQQILNLLTPTDDPNSLAWRKRCQDRLDRRWLLTDGTLIQLREPVSFSDGHVDDMFTIEKRGQQIALRAPSSHSRYHIRNLLDLDWSVIDHVPPTAPE